ncbi:hypothetical protein PCANC_11844 [Puccinia coronata f. sp. avenae]|uniref:Glycosyltransferase family 69 protein n=1 Tax=Puccinia coronata f. sp. avenae TaxID=200324 RepID=A0A2N5T0B8_9BASI|nr:hypothetical protein PCANC_11844 [Puccinia coronata f. sp. avenae]
MNPIRRRRQSSVLLSNSEQQPTHTQNQNQNQHPSGDSMSSPRSSQSYNLRSLLAAKLPALISLAIGIVVGLLFALILSATSNNSTLSSKQAQWRGGANLPTWTHSRTAATKFSVPIPTLDQRFRVFNLLSTLTGYHTQTCTKSSQNAYKRQVYERYEPLLGYDPTRSKTHHGPVHLLKHIVPGFNDPDQNFNGIYDHYLERWTTTTTTTTTKEQQYTRAPQRKATGHKYFFAINLYNSFDNVFVSVYENGSSDQTKALLRLFDGLSRSVGIRVVIRTSLRTRGAFHHRIEYLAEVRNAALAPLQELRDSEGELFDTVIFMNDVLPCTDDLLELIWQSRRQNAGITCGADYIFHEEIAQPVFYDNWVARDINGTALENAPFESIFRDPPSQHAFERHLPIQVQSCWNGIAILDPAPLYAHPRVRFRMARLAEGEIVMVPRVKLAYDNRVWQIIHPERKNLTVIRGYTRLGGTPDDPTADPQDRAWFGPHDRLFRLEESEEIAMKPEPAYVWCWGWDGAGDLDGPDVDPIWEPTKNLTMDPRLVRHDRGFDL